MFPRRWILTAATAAAILISGAAFAQSKEDKDRAELKARSDETLKVLFGQVEGSKALYDKAAGYAVFAATKAGFIVTGGGGSGTAVDKASGETSYMKMGTGGVGFGVGAEKFDMVILFETKERLATFHRWRLGQRGRRQGPRGQARSRRRGRLRRRPGRIHGRRKGVDGLGRRLGHQVLAR